MKIVLCIVLTFIFLWLGPIVNSGPDSESESLAPLMISSQKSIGESEQIVAHLPLRSGKKLLIRITLPQNFEKGKKFPVLLGPGLDGGKLEVGCRYFGTDPGQYGWILVESLVHMKDKAAMEDLLDYLDANYLVEGYHLLGFSANSVYQFRLAEAMAPRISSVTAMPGNPNLQDPAVALSYKDIKILMVVGERDHWWLKKAIDAERRLRDYGLSARLLVVPNGGHILDEFSGRPLFDELHTLRTFHN